MTSLIVTIGIFLVCFLAHAVLHRALAGRGMKRSVLVYVIGGFVLSVCFTRYHLMYPVSSILLFIFLSLTAIYFYIALSLGGETPASMILASYAKKNRQTKSQIINLFSDQGLLWKRLDDLKGAGFITEKKGLYRATGKGKTVMKIISLYQTIFHRSLTT